EAERARLGAVTEPADGGAVAQVEADAAPLAAATAGEAEHARAVGLRRIEHGPTLGVAARAVELEEQLPVAHALARVEPRLRPRERRDRTVVVVGRVEEVTTRLRLCGLVRVRGRAR